MDPASAGSIKGVGGEVIKINKTNKNMMYLVPILQIKSVSFLII